MTIECYNSKCKKHSCNSGDPSDEGPFCYEAECQFEPLVPARYTEEELERIVLTTNGCTRNNMRSKRFELWFADRYDLSMLAVADMWTGSSYESCDYFVELAWAAWCEALNGARL